MTRRFTIFITILFFALITCQPPRAFGANKEQDKKTEAKTAAEAPKSKAEKDMQANPARTRRRIHEGKAFSIGIENDSKNIGGPGSDQAYSDGFKLAYIYAKDHVPVWAPEWVVESKFLKDEISGAKANFGISLNHQIYTPNNVRVMGLQRNDRPYAAWLNAALSMHLKNEFRSKSVEFSFGVVGPAAMGEGVQNGFHRLIGVQPAEGWGNQLKNEPAIQLGYQQRIHFFELKNRYGPWFDLIPMVGGGLGNVFIGIR